MFARKKRSTLPSLYFPSSESCRGQWDHLLVSSSPDRTPKMSSDSPCGKHAFPPFHQLFWPPLDTFKYLNMVLVLQGSELRIVLKVRHHQYKLNKTWELPLLASWLMLSLLYPAPADPFLLSRSPATYLPVCLAPVFGRCFYSIAGTEPALTFAELCAIADAPIYLYLSSRPLVCAGSQLLLLTHTPPHTPPTSIKYHHQTC